MLLVKKLTRRPHSVAHLLLVVSPSYAFPPGKGFCTTDDLNKVRFWVDTGACHSIHLTGPLENRHPKDIGLCLVAANSSTIATYGTKTFHLSFSGCWFSWTFVLDNIRMPLWGADFLAHYHPLIDVACSHLINISSYSSMPLQTSLTPKDITFVTALSKFQHFHEKYSKVFHPKLRQFSHAPPKNGIYHHMKMTGPIHPHFRRLSLEKLQEAKQTFLHMEEMDLCQKASSP